MSDPSVNAARFTNVFHTHYHQVLAYARRRVGADDAHDVVAETFLAAWRHVEDLPASPLPWLYRAASLEVAHRRRSIGRAARFTRELIANASSQTGSDPADEIAELHAWASAFCSLPDLDREVLMLAAWERLAAAEAAEVLGCSPTAFKVRLHRARRRLARHAEAIGGESTLCASGARSQPAMVPPSTAAVRSEET